jgi:hypothetical protein
MGKNKIKFAFIGKAGLSLLFLALDLIADQKPLLNNL